MRAMHATSALLCVTALLCVAVPFVARGNKPSAGPDVDRPPYDCSRSGCPELYVCVESAGWCGYLGGSGTIGTPCATSMDCAAFVYCIEGVCMPSADGAVSGTMQSAQCDDRCEPYELCVSDGQCAPLSCLESPYGDQYCPSGTICTEFDIDAYLKARFRLSGAATGVPPNVQALYSGSRCVPPCPKTACLEYQECDVTTGRCSRAGRPPFVDRLDDDQSGGCFCGTQRATPRRPDVWFVVALLSVAIGFSRARRTRR